MLGIFESYGIVTDPRQMRALTDLELANRSAQQWQAISPALHSFEVERGMMNWQSPQLPLDERYADFKARLAAALVSRGRVK